MSTNIYKMVRYLLCTSLLVANPTLDLRIEFCKSQARADRWAEEVELLQEEMKRVKLFLQTRSDKWAAQARVVGNSIHMQDEATAEGLRAYANEQASQYSAMWSRCEHLWRHVAEYVALGVGEVVPTEVQDVDDDTQATDD
jgi:hypothetical protein